MLYNVSANGEVEIKLRISPKSPGNSTGSTTFLDLEDRVRSFPAKQTCIRT